MDFKRNLTSKDFFRLLSSQWLTGSNQLTAEARYEQARWVQRCRNFFFTASCPVPTAIPVGNVYPGKLIGMTSRFSDAVILTDALTMVDRGTGGATTASPLLEVFDIGGERNAYGDDYFGLSGPVPHEYLLKHERNADVTAAAAVLPDRPAKWLGFIPRILKPNQVLRVEYSSVPSDYPQLQIGFRGLRVLEKDNPYQYLSTDEDTRLRRYIAQVDPQTFFMDVTVPVATVRAATLNPVKLRTPQQERPLLILGATCNLQGAQGALYDESKQYRFDLPDTPLDLTQSVRQGYRAVPLNLWAPNSEMHNPDTYNVFPVPHFLAPGSVLRIELTDGLMPDNAGANLQRSVTPSSQDVRITFLCRTV